jgi:hypothetical protein
MKLLLVLLVIAFASAQDPSDNPNFGNELSNINFDNIIGGPFRAVINAQNLAARTTMDFIEDVAFTQLDPNDPNSRTVNMFAFRYRALQTANDTTTISNFTMEVPLLILMPVPYLQFDNVDLDFNVKLNSVARVERTFSLGVGIDLTVKRDSSFFRPTAFELKVSIKSQYTSKRTGEVKREYSLNVKVRASQSALPAGTERVLDLFDSIIREGIP